MLSYILNFIWCQILPDSEDEYEREYTDLSNLPIDLVSEEYPYEKPNDYSQAWNQFVSNNKRTKFSTT